MEKGNVRLPAQRHNSLNMRSIFRCMMECGYYPEYEKTHIMFAVDDNTGVVEYEEGILSIRVFFTIEEDAYDLFLEASNSIMAETYIVKPVILDDMKNIMFSFEMLCGNLREFKKNFPYGVECLKNAIILHKKEMKNLILAENVSSAAMLATEDTFAISKGVKPLS